MDVQRMSKLEKSPLEYHRCNQLREINGWVWKSGGKILKRNRIFTVSKVSPQKYVSNYKGKIDSEET